MAKPSFTHTRITVDGRTYASVGEMPPDVRRKYEATVGRLLADRDGNGIPDVIESGTVDGAVVTHVTTTTSEVYEINGRQYSSLGDVPPQFRQVLERLHPPVPHDAAGSPSPSPGGGLFAGRSPLDSSAESGLHIRLSWAALALVAAGLALVAWIAYRAWGR